MKNPLHFLLLLFFIGIGFSFTSNSAVDYAGTYGVSDSDISQIKLQLNSDMTFSYQDLSESENEIRISGSWTVDKNQVELHSSDSSTYFHTKWKVEKDGSAVKSQKGICFYRLLKKD